MEFKARLKAAREKSGYTQTEMAVKLGISQAYYSKFEQGTGEPNLNLLGKLSEILEISLDYLIMGKVLESGMEIEKHRIILKTLSDISSVLNSFYIKLEESHEPDEGLRMRIINIDKQIKEQTDGNQIYSRRI